MATKAGVKAGNAFIVIEAVDKTAMVLKRVGQRFKAWGSQLTSMGRDLVSKAIGILAPLGVSAVTFARFDDSMRKVEARSAGTAEEMQAIRDQARQLNTETRLSADAIGMLQAKLAQKGFNRKDILNMTRDVSLLAIGAGEGVDAATDLTQAADLVSGALRAWQLDSSNAGKVADIFTAAVNNSNFTLDGLISSLSTAGPIAKQFGVDIEDTVATLGGLTNLNIDPSAAGTAFRNMMLKLSSAAGRDTFNKNLEEMTGNVIDFTDANGNLRNLPQLIFAIAEATKDLGTAERGDLLNQLFGLRAIVPAAALGQNMKDFEKLVAVLRNAGGTAEKTAQLMDAGLGGVLARVVSMFSELMITVGEAISGELSFLLEWLTSAIKHTSDFIKENPKLIAIILAIGVAAGVAGTTLMALGVVVSVIGTAISGLGALLTGLLAPLALVIANFVIWMNNLDMLGVSATQVGDTIGTVFQTVLSWLNDQFGNIITTAQMMMKGITDAIMAGRVDLAFKVGLIGTQVLWQQSLNWLLEKWDQFSFGVSAIAIDLWDGLRTIFIGGFHFIKLALAQMLAWVANNMTGTLNDIFDAVITAQEALGMTSTVMGALARKIADSPGSLDNLVAEARQEGESAIAKIGQENIAKRQALRDQYDQNQMSRQNKLQGLQEEMQATLAEIAKAQEAAGMEVANAIQEAPAFDPNAFAGQLATQAAKAPPGVLKGLERGTAEAIEQALKNRRNNQMDKLVDLGQQQVDALNNIDDAIEELDGLGAV